MLSELLRINFIISLASDSLLPKNPLRTLYRYIFSRSRTKNAPNIGGALMRFGCQAQWSAAHPADDRSERGALRPIIVVYAMYNINPEINRAIV